MKIAICEIGSRNHYVYLETLINILKDDNKIYIYTRKETRDLINADLVNSPQISLYLKTNRSLSGFLHEVKKSIEKERIDILFLTTVQTSIHNFIFFRPKTKMFLTIHNINAWLSNNTDERSLKYFLKGCTRRIILKNMTGICVLEQNLKHYIESNHLYTRTVLLTPFMISREKDDQEQNNDKLQLVVPGQIDKKRRKYDRILAAVKLLKNYKNRFTVILLGRPVGAYGQEVINECNKLVKEGLDIRYYNEFISDSDYEETMKNSHIILSDLVETLNYDGYREQYGKSKSTGVFFNIIKYGLPAVINDEIEIDSLLQEVVTSYTNIDNLRAAIESFILEQDKIQEFKNKAKYLSQEFSIRAKKELIKQIDSIMQDRNK